MLSAARFSAAYAAARWAGLGVPPACGGQRRHIGHGVGGGTDRHPAIGLGVDRPVAHCLGVQPVRDLFGRRADLLIAQPIQRGAVGAQLGVQHRPVPDRQAGGFPHDQGGPPLRERPAFQRGQGVRHVLHQRLGHRQIPATTGRGIPTRQPNLAGHPAAPLGGRHAGGGLTEADYCFVCDPWWSPAAEAQAIDRTHRIGQTRPVTVYRLVSQGTIEERVVALQERKRELFTAVVDEGEVLGSAITASDIRALLG